MVSWPFVAFGLLTTTFAGPTTSAPVVQTIVAPLTTVTPVHGVFPIVTVEVPVESFQNPVPVMVTTVPPAAGPLVGMIDVTVGVGEP